jgi:Flp pilus assembly protein TadD
MHKGFSLLMLTVLLGAGDGEALGRAREFYQRTEYEAALRELERVEPKSAEALALMGKAYYGQGKFKEASEALERAVAAEPQNAHYWNWLGKAFGRRAEFSSFLTAPRYASQCRRAFEKAVELEPANVKALSDLFSYYLDAPGFLGGGVEKAEAIAGRIRQLDPAEYHWTQAELANKRKEFGSAEQHLRRAAELAPKHVGRLLDVARFLARHGRRAESDAIFEQAKRMAPEDPEILFAQAGAYIDGNREPDRARALLKQYLASNLTPGHPPRWEAERLLKRIPGG